MASEHSIIGIGAALVDTEVRVLDSDIEHIGVEKGLMTLCDDQTQSAYIQRLQQHIDTAERACGGSAANSMMAAAQMGTTAFLTCQVADDTDGRFFLEELENGGVGYNRAGQFAAGTTGKCLVLVTPDAERTMNTCLGVSETLSPENIEVAALDSAEYIYIEGYLATSETGRAAAIALREAAQARNVKIAMSLSDPGIVAHFRTQLADILGSKIDLIFCNEAEAIAWTDAADINEAAETLKSSCHRYAITLGAKGALCWDGETLTEAAAPKVDAVDTNGAGDMFAGVALAAICQGYTLSDATKFGCIAASKVVTQFGPRLHNEDIAQLAESLFSQKLA